MSVEESVSRVRRFLTTRERMGGIDQERIIGADYDQLLRSDLEVLIAAVSDEATEEALEQSGLSYEQPLANDFERFRSAREVAVIRLTGEV